MATSNVKAAPAPKTKAPAKVWTDQERAANFKAAASKRTNRAIKALRALSGVARPSRYAWTPEQVGKILSTIAGELRAVESRFQNPGKRNAEEFSL